MQWKPKSIVPCNLGFEATRRAVVDGLKLVGLWMEIHKWGQAMAHTGLNPYMLCVRSTRAFEIYATLRWSDLSKDDTVQSV